MWEKVSDSAGFWTTRTKVPGGWIVITTYRCSGVGAAIAQTFVADPNHQWKLEDKK